MAPSLTFLVILSNSGLFVLAGNSGDDFTDNLFTDLAPYVLLYTSSCCRVADLLCLPIGCCLFSVRSSHSNFYLNASLLPSAFVSTY